MVVVSIIKMIHKTKKIFIKPGAAFTISGSALPVAPLLHAGLDGSNWSRFYKFISAVIYM
jgi:hypothetical protein